MNRRSRNNSSGNPDPDYSDDVVVFGLAESRELLHRTRTVYKSWRT